MEFLSSKTSTSRLLVDKFTTITMFVFSLVDNNEEFLRNIMPLTLNDDTVQYHPQIYHLFMSCFNLLNHRAGCLPVP